MRKGFLIPPAPSHVTNFFLQWAFFPLFSSGNNYFLESRLKGPTYAADNSKTWCSSKTRQPCPYRIPLSAAWPSRLARAAEQALSLVPSGLCKIKIHHRHSTWCIFVLGAGSSIAICGCEQLLEVTEPAFRETPEQSQDVCKAADAQLCNAEDLCWLQRLYNSSAMITNLWPGAYCQIPGVPQSHAKAQETVTTTEQVKWNLSLAHTNNFMCKLAHAFQFFSLLHSWEKTGLALKFPQNA